MPVPIVFLVEYETGSSHGITSLSRVCNKVVPTVAATNGSVESYNIEEKLRQDFEFTVV